MQTCGMSVIKYILFAFNFVFAISGLGILIAGAIVLADLNEFGHFLEGKLIAPPIVLICTGAIIFLVASLGCYGAIRESPLLLMMFAVALAAIFIVELACGIAACVYRADLQQMLRSPLEQSIVRGDAQDIAAWDNVQRKLECCGVNGPADWADYSRNKTLRASCCQPAVLDMVTKDCRRNQSPYQQKYYQDGCLMKLEQRVSSNAVILIGVGIGVAFVQVLGIGLACWLAAAIRKGDN